MSYDKDMVNHFQDHQPVDHSKREEAAYYRLPGFSGLRLEIRSITGLQVEVSVNGAG